MVTSPRGAERMPASSTSPRYVLPPNVGASPWPTRTRTEVWWSLDVANARVRSHGILALRWTTTSHQPATVSTTSAGGVTSTSAAVGPMRIGADLVGRRGGTQGGAAID